MADNNDDARVDGGEEHLETNNADADADDDDSDEFGADVAVDMDALTAGDDVETVENSDGVVVATATGLDALTTADGAKWECTACGAMNETEHGAKTHFGRLHDADDVKHPEHADDADEDGGADVDVVGAVKEHIENDEKRGLHTDVTRISRGRGEGKVSEEDVPDVDGVTLLFGRGHHSRCTRVYVAVERGVDPSDVQRVVEPLPWSAQEAALNGPDVVIGDRASELHDECIEFRDVIDRVREVKGVEQGGALRSAEPPVDLGAGPEDDGDGEAGDSDDDEVTWDDVRSDYDSASVSASPENKTNARDTVVEALEAETDWMSIIERCNETTYDLWHLTGDGWDENGYKHCESRMRDELGSIATDTEVRHVVAQLATANYVEEENTNARHLDETLVPVLNGVINIDGIEYDADMMTIDWGSVEVQDMQPNEHRFLYRVQTEWDLENADLEGLDEWLETITRTDEARRIIWEMAGHALHPRYPVDAMLVFLGDGGSGKSQTLEVVKQTLGSENTSVKTLSAIQGERFAGKHVVDSRANINTELTGTKFNSINKLKTYSAGEEDSVEGKGTAAFKSPNDATMMFASDDPPSFPTNRALGRRLYPVEFPCSYVSDPDPDNPFELQSRSKLEVQAELQADARLKAALMRAVEGLKRLLEEGNPTSSKSWEERVAQYESYADPIHDFARNALVPDDDSAVESGDMKATFDAFADAKDHGGKTMQQIVDVLEEMPAYPISKDRTRGFADDQRKHTVYHGVAFSDDAREDWVPESAYWSQYGDRPGAEDDDDDRDSSEFERVELGDVTTPGRYDAVKVEAVSVQDEPAPWLHDQGVVGDDTGTLRYESPDGIELDEGETYVLRDVIVTEDDADLKLQLIDGMTDVYRIEEREDGEQPVSDDPGRGDSVQTPDAGRDDDRSVSEDIDREVLRHADETDSAAALAGVVVDEVTDADLQTVEQRIEKLRERGDIILGEPRDMTDDDEDTGDGDDGNGDEVVDVSGHVIDAVRALGGCADKDDLAHLFKHDTPPISPHVASEVVERAIEAGVLTETRRGVRVAGGES